MASIPLPPYSPPEASSQWCSLRVWPVVALLVLMGLTRFIPSLLPDKSMAVVIAGALGPLICGILILIWWLAASRATWRERVAGFLGVILAFAILSRLVHPSMQGSGFIYPMAPMGIAGFAIGALIFRKTLTFRRTWFALLFASIGFSAWTLTRNSGMTGDYALDLHWRWTESPEEIMLTKKADGAPTLNDNADPTAIAAAAAYPQWPGFRGQDRSAIAPGPSIDPDWDTHPPELLWKTAVGPGWASFAVAGDYLFTQEQRGPRETVVCYHAGTGREIWASGIDSRFEEPLGGPGPRATPTVTNGGVFALGAEGWILRLAPGTGEILWKQDIREIADRKPPQWGFSSSPLVTESVVIVHAGGSGDKGTLAFDVKSGELRWSAPSGDHSYSSPQLATLAGVESVLMMSNRGIELLDPETGVPRLQYDWTENTYRALQPAVIDGDSLLLPTGMNFGTRRIQITKNGDTFAAAEVWTSRRLKPDFNDFVIFQDHAYGFDASIFTAIDLETGERAWKGGRYGKGQVLLLENSALLLVASEQGEIVLLTATPDAHNELARFQALEGKTWNHPVVIGDRLYVRNAQEAACYRLKLAESPGQR